ncbi:TPA: hypothetical protein ACF2SP_001470, partial [Legionella pneumophila]
MLRRSLKTKNLKFLIPVLVTNMLMIGILISSNIKLDVSLLQNLYLFPIKAEIASAPIIIFLC